MMNTTDRSAMIGYLQRIQQLARARSSHDYRLHEDVRTDLLYIEQYASAIEARLRMEETGDDNATTSTQPETSTQPDTQAVVTGKEGSKPLGPEEAHVKNVTAITRYIFTLERQLRANRQEHKTLTVNLRAARRELRAVLQRDTRMTLDAQAELAGVPDAIDAAEHRRER